MRNIELMLNYLESQNMAWLEMESAQERVQDLGEAEDPRVDVCIYCIPPHRVRPNDLR